MAVCGKQSRQSLKIGKKSCQLRRGSPPVKPIDRVCLSTNGNAARISRKIQESSTSFGGCEHIRQ